jgi:hypothetical protein
VDSEIINDIKSVRQEIINSLKKCEYHPQGCLISDNGRHLKLDNDMITVWARAMVNYLYFYLILLIIYLLIYFLIN